MRLTDALFHWVVDRAVIVDLLSASSSQVKARYTLEVFRDGETIAVVSVPVSWVKLLPEVWGQRETLAIEVA